VSLTWDDTTASEAVCGWLRAADLAMPGWARIGWSACSA